MPKHRVGHWASDISRDHLDGVRLTGLACLAQTLRRPKRRQLHRPDFKPGLLLMRELHFICVFALANDVIASLVSAAENLEYAATELGS
jgi:hypothetical protein